MKADEIRLMFEYMDWANGRILIQLDNLTHEQYITPTGLGISFKSLRGTMVHMLDSIWQWRITFQGYYDHLLTDAEYAATELTEDQIPTLAALLERWEVETREMRAYIDALDDEKVNGLLHYV